MTRLLLALTAMLLLSTPAAAQTTDDDIWREMDLSEVDVRRERDHCLRLYCYYRFIEDGGEYIAGRKRQVYDVYEGICQMDVRYTKKWDDGIRVIAGRNLVHPDGNTLPEDIDYWQIKPYTFLEKARRLPKKYTLETDADTTRVYTHRGLSGIAVRDTARQELVISYNALAPDTALTINILLANVHFSRVDAHAVYRLDDAATSYVPQGNLKHISFEGDIDGTLYPHVKVSTDETGRSGAMRFRYHDRTEFWVDSAVYLSRSDYNASRRLTAQQQREQSPYTAADIDRLKAKLGVPPLSASVLQRIEDQRDWDDEFAQWRRVDKRMKALDKAGRKVQQQAESLQQNPAARKIIERVEQQVEQAVEKLYSEDE